MCNLDAGSLYAQYLEGEHETKADLNRVSPPLSPQKYLRLQDFVGPCGWVGMSRVRGGTNASSRNRLEVIQYRSITMRRTLQKLYDLHYENEEY